MPRDLHELPKLRDGLSYLYAEHCRIEQDALAIALWDKEGCTHVPAAALGVLMLGPGTAITHAAVKALADNGCAITWCGEDGIRCYANGGGETRKAYRLLRQAYAAMDATKHAEVVWRMYAYRFGYTLPPGLTLPQVRGKEGARMRDAYAEASETYGVAWSGRRYDRGNWGNADPINRALSAANACLNGLCYTAIVSGGYSPALGFVHTSKQLSFVYDIADLYKTEITIPLAFRLTAESTENVDKRVRAQCRETFREARLLQRLLPDIDAMLAIGPEPETRESIDSDAGLPTSLWEELLGRSVEVSDVGDAP